MGFPALIRRRCPPHLYLHFSPIHRQKTGEEVCGNDIFCISTHSTQSVHPLLLHGVPGLTLIHVNPASSRTRDKVSRMHRNPFQAFDSFRRRSESAIATDPSKGDSDMSLWTIILIILVIALLGGFSGIGGGLFYGTGYYGGGGLGLVIVVLLVLLLLGKL